LCERLAITCLSLPFAEKQTTCHFDCKRQFKLRISEIIWKFYKSVNSIYLNLKNARMKLFGCTYLMHFESHYSSLHVNVFYIPKVRLQGWHIHGTEYFRGFESKWQKWLMNIFVYVGCLPIPTDIDVTQYCAS